MAILNTSSAIALTASIISAGFTQNMVFADECKVQNTNIAYQTPTQQIITNDRNTQANTLLLQPELTGKTTQYIHGVFGEKFEYDTLSLMQGSVSFALPTPDVFEDRTIRITDLDQNGKPDFLQVVANAHTGARLMVLELDGDRLSVKAESQPIGLGNRWLNPVGVGDFDGDGELEIASVRTPHIGGIVEIHQLSGGKLVKTATLPGYSNHSYGSREQGLGAVVYGIGQPDKLLLVNQSKNTMAMLKIQGQSITVEKELRFNNSIKSLAVTDAKIRFSIQGFDEIKSLNLACLNR